MRSRPGLGFLLQREDDLRLGIGVRPPVVTPYFGRLALRLRVTCAGVGGDAQVVTEQDVVALPARARRANVHVDFAWKVGERPEETMQIVATSELHADGFELRDVLLFIEEVGNRDLNVDDWLCRKAGHGGRAHMLDAHHGRSECRGYSAPPLLKSRAPFRVVVKDDDGVEAFAPRGDSEPGPEVGSDRA